MGASGWDYVTSYEGSVERSLEALHARVFDEDYGGGEEYATLEDLWADAEFMGNEGTHSILDVQTVVHSTEPPSQQRIEDYGTLRPLAPDRIRHHFGTDRPTPDAFTERLARSFSNLTVGPEREKTLIDKCTMRWTGVYVMLYTGDEPTHLGIFGYSGD